MGPSQSILSWSDRWDIALLNCGSCVMSEVKRFTATCGGFRRGKYTGGKHHAEMNSKRGGPQSFILPKQLLDNIIIIIIIIIIMVYHGQVCWFCINSECNHSPLERPRYNSTIFLDWIMLDHRCKPATKSSDHCTNTRFPKITSSRKYEKQPSGRILLWESWYLSLCSQVLSFSSSISQSCTCTEGSKCKLFHQLTWHHLYLKLSKQKWNAV